MGKGRSQVRFMGRPMTQCPDCQEPLETERGDFPWTGSQTPRITLRDVTRYECQGCGQIGFILPDEEKEQVFRRAAAELLLRGDLLSPAECLFVETVVDDLRSNDPANVIQSGAGWLQVGVGRA